MNGKVLVATASKHGSTFDIAHEIARTLESRDFEVTDQQITEVPGLGEYDAVVIGSAVYAGHWLSEATKFVDRNADALRARPVWLFSSGPLGDPPKPAVDPVGLPDLIKRSGAREHRLFGGRIDPEQLGFAERAIVKVVGAPKGDFRDFDSIRSWAQDIADTILADESRVATVPLGAGRSS